MGYVMHLEMIGCRERLGLTRTQIARWARCSDMSVARYEAGSKLHTALAQRLAVVLYAMRTFEGALVTGESAGTATGSESATFLASEGVTVMDPKLAAALGVEPPPPSSGVRFDIERATMRGAATGKRKVWTGEKERLISKDEARAFAIGTLKLRKGQEGKSWRIVEVTR